jgi:hypothetical protein
MTISITVRADNAIVIYDEDDPRYGVVLEKINDVASLIAALNRTVAQVHGERTWRWAGMRAVAEAVADTDGDWSLN